MFLGEGIRTEDHAELFCEGTVSWPFESRGVLVPFLQEGWSKLDEC